MTTREIIEELDLRANNLPALKALAAVLRIASTTAGRLKDDAVSAMEEATDIDMIERLATGGAFFSAAEDLLQQTTMGTLTLIAELERRHEAKHRFQP